MTDDTPLFARLSPEQLAEVVRHGTSRQFPRNAVIITEGDQSDSFYVIEEGRVKVYVSDEQGREFVIRHLGTDDYFGELALIEDSPRTASVMTTEAAKLKVVSKAAFRECLERNPEISWQLLRAMAERMRTLTDTVRDLALLDVYGRVAHTLLKLASEHEGEQIIEPRLTHQEIANMVGASREMVSRIMKDLSTGGYVETRQRKIIIRSKLPAAW
jgi:CRP/FNR family cyclic AMP-dependent transcriptional regulator